eukprot:TRINITY_DN124642_c0_g1_i1.p1 TRINITY_DN124642_c0_g1~~TRINITY_DN124642_c0_g1_i1.p1  ORF type:complete len:207 (-),score=34.11 TRINITY_DN124642_c0_g1_i1:121-657(-)
MGCGNSTEASAPQQPRSNGIVTAASSVGAARTLLGSQHRLNRQGSGKPNGKLNIDVERVSAALKEALDSRAAPSPAEAIWGSPSASPDSPDSSIVSGSSSAEVEEEDNPQPLAEVCAFLAPISESASEEVPRTVIAKPPLPGEGGSQKHNSGPLSCCVQQADTLDAGTELTVQQLLQL